MSSGEDPAWVDIACRLFCVACGCIAGLGIFTVGAYLLWSQHHKVSTFRATDGRILDWQLKVVSGDEGPEPPTGGSYALVAKYDYQVGGRVYTSDRPFSIPGSAAAKVLAAGEQFRPGDKATVYYNPADPSEAFVLRGDILMPCILVFLGVLMFVSLISIFGIGMSSLPSPRKRVVVLLLGVFWHLAGVFVIASYVTVGSHISHLGAFAALVVGYELLGLLPLLYGLHGSVLFGSFRPATAEEMNV